MFRFAFVVLVTSLILNVSAQRNMEDLGRGIVAIRTSSSQVFISWRMLADEPEDIVFNLYRDTTLVVSTSATNYIDSTSLNKNYSIRTVIGGVEQEASMKAGVQTKAYYSIPLKPIDNHYVHFVWVGDLDGDGEYDYVVDRIPQAEDQSAKIEAYRRDGTFLWQVDMGPNGVNRDNIVPGSAAISNGHNDGVTVYDLDSDGQAEVILKTSNGVVFGDGSTLQDSNNDAQFISVLNGITGAEEVRAPIPQDYISIGPVQGHFGIMYCDTINPSFVFKAKNRRADGGFNLMVVTYDYKDDELIQRWKWNQTSEKAPNFHQIRIIDIDGDGRDELCDGGYVLDDDGTYLYEIPDVVHGDRFHITDIDPDRPGLEGYCIQQDNPTGLAWAYYDAKDGTIIRRQDYGNADYGRGTVADLDPRYRGLEFWTFTDGMYTAQTDSAISTNYPWPNFKIWWDGDELAELLNSENISKWDYDTESEQRLLTAGNYGAVDSWRDAAQFHGDIMGDWREEVIFGSSDQSEIMIFTTTYPTERRIYTLPQNPGYRACMTIKGYQQSHLVDYYLGDGMTNPPLPNIAFVADTSTNDYDLPPFRPQNLSAIASHDSVLLSWNETIDTSVTGYNIYRSIDSTDNFIKLNDTLLPETSYIDTNVVFETFYYYTVSAVISDTNESSQSNYVSARPTQYPSIPEGFNAVDMEDTVKLMWNKNTELNITGYNVYRTDTLGNTYVKLNSEIIEDVSFLDLDIENGKLYYYVITSINDFDLESAYSDVVLGMPGIKVIFEAEHAIFGNGSTHDSNHDGFYGTGFINFPSADGFVEFRNVSGGADGGDYTLRYRHALGNNGRTGMLDFNESSKSITMEGTGDWTNWIMTDVAITLLPGSDNVIRFQSTGNDFGNLDRIIILPYKTIEKEEPVSLGTNLMDELHLQSYPNPFTSETTIQYTLPQAGFVSLRVFDMLGHTVAVLVNQYQSAGSHRVIWNASDSNGSSVSTGVYFYEFVTDNYHQIRKMTLVE